MLKQYPYLFVDRDGTLIKEPPDQQVDRLDKLSLMPNVIPALRYLIRRGYRLVMVTNQDGLGTVRFPIEDFEKPHRQLLAIFESQGILFEQILICPHLESDQCVCRKPNVGLLLDYLTNQSINLKRSYVIGDRETDMELADRLNLPGLKIGSPDMPNWQNIVRAILNQQRTAHVTRQTAETSITVSVQLPDLDSIQELPTKTEMLFDQSTTFKEEIPLDQVSVSLFEEELLFESQSKIDAIHTRIGFFDHMLAQLIKHAGITASIQAEGDLIVDDHHTVEDVALAFGEALTTALGDKWGMARYGFVLPMDEAQAHVSLDLSGRPYCQFKGEFKRAQVGALSTELVPHFFQSWAVALGATLHIAVTGDNDHHKIEAVFKAVGRSLRQAIAAADVGIPSTKGVL